MCSRYPFYEDLCIVDGLCRPLVISLLDTLVERLHLHNVPTRDGFVVATGNPSRHCGYFALCGEDLYLLELIDEFCGGMSDGHELLAFLPGGASGGILPASLAGEPLDFDTLQPHGAFIGSAAVIVLSQQDALPDAARNLMRFFRHESCGQCTPCRAGTAKTVELLGQPRWDVALLQDLSRTMIDASICGLGQAAPNPVLSLLRHFPEVISR